MIYYIGDTHFGHRAIVRYDKENNPDLQGFFSVGDRDECIIRNWNERVTDKDDVYVDGDFSFYGIEETRSILHRLNGRKHMMIGNHDANFLYRLAQDRRTRIADVQTGIQRVRDGDDDVYLCHYPILNWDGQHRGTYHVYAHVHQTPEEGIFQQAGASLCSTMGMSEFRAMNCGCMLHGYKPVTLAELKRKYGVGHEWHDKQYTRDPNRRQTAGGTA